MVGHQSSFSGLRDRAPPCLPGLIRVKSFCPASIQKNEGGEESKEQERP
jgi:hypothetical protein